jgi:hypothetical protein
MRARDARAVYQYLKSIAGSKEGGDGGKASKNPD